MDATIDESPFTDFGLDPLLPGRRMGLSKVEAADSESLRSEVRRFVPKLPGVYGMIDLRGRLIYVGKSKCLRNRLLSYFLPNNEEDKAGRIVQSTCQIVWELQPSEFAALLREQSLIRSFQPRFNVQGIPRRQQSIYVCLGKSPAETLYSSRFQDPQASCVIGPVFGSARTNRAIEVLNRTFQLRDCSSKQPCSFTDQMQLFEIGLRPGCIRLELQTCLGPCISACSRSAYEAKVKAAKEFMMGRNNAVIHEVHQAMLRAAEHLHFEQAARLREDLKAIEWLNRRACDMARARDQFTFVYPVACEGQWQKKSDGVEVWYLIRRGTIEGAVVAPRTTSERSLIQQKIEHWLASEKTVGTEFASRPETLALVTSWFRNHRDELKKTFLPTSDGHPPKSTRQARGTSVVKV